MKLSEKATRFRRTKSAIREIMDYADPMYIRGLGLDPSDIISFAGGWVAHAAPEGLRRAYRDIVEDSRLFHLSGGYSPSLGMPSCREALVRYEKHLYGMELKAKQVVVGLGSTQLLYDLFQVLLDPGDSILLLDPSYCNYPLQVAWATEARILRFPVLNDSWEFVADQRVDELSEYILEHRPRVVLLVIPDNPTGQMLSDEFVGAVLESMKQVGGFLVIDFAYKELTFGDFPHYFSWGPTDNFLSVHSGSKWSRSLGRRLGWIEAVEPIIEAMESVQGSSILCPDTLHQMALTRYINEAIEENTLRSYVGEIRQQYQCAARHTVTCIEEYLKHPCLESQGGLYTCIKLGTDGAKFVKDILQATGVLFVPGWGFGRTMRDAVRLSYGPLVDDLETISRGLEKVGRIL